LKSTEELSKKAAKKAKRTRDAVVYLGAHARVQSAVDKQLGAAAGFKDALGSAFNQSHGMETFNPLRAAWDNVAGFFVSRQARAIDKLAKKYPLAGGAPGGTWAAVWEAIRRGEEPAADALKAPYAELSELVG